MKKILILLLLIIQVGISTVLGQISPQKPDLQEFDDFERLEIVNIEEADSILLDEIKKTFQLATKAMTELKARQTYNNAIIENGNNKIAELNRKAATLHGLVKGYFSDRDTTQRTKLMEFLGVKEYENDTLLALMVNTKIETMQLEGETINDLQDKSIEQNIQDKKFCDELIVHWKTVMTEMMRYFSEKNLSKSDRENAKVKLQTALKIINDLCKKNI